MPKYEIRFHSENTHPYYVVAESEDLAKAQAVANHNKGRQSTGHTNVDRIVVCEPTNKVPLESIATPYTKSAGYMVNVPIDMLEGHLERYAERGSLVLEPEFQRAHVWTEYQQIRFVEHMLKGGTQGRDIFFNSPGWARGESAPIVLVDGLQRLTALRKFLRGDLKVFGNHTIDSFEYLNGICLNVHVNDLPTEKAVLQWYLEMNGGGTPHTEEELDKVRKMLRNIE